MEHIALEVFNRTGLGSKFANLPQNTRIRIRRSSRIFGKGEIWSFPFNLDVRANAGIFSTAGELHGSRLHEQVHNRKARLWVEGVPLYMGALKLDDEADVDEDGNVDVKFEGGQKTFDQLTDGAKANQVPMLGDVQIGLALWRKRWVHYALQFKAAAKYSDGTTSPAQKVSDYNESNGLVNITFDGERPETPIQEYPRMVFPKGTFYNNDTHSEETVDFLNMDSPYTEDSNGTPTHPFCNIALCYQKYGYERKQADGTTRLDYDSEPEAQRGYEYMPANRVNSAPCFFVLYWIRALMTHLGIHIDENQLMNVEDLRRLFFVNTKCAYEEPKGYFRNGEMEPRYGNYNSDNKSVPDRKIAEHITYTKTLAKVEPYKFECTGYYSKDGSPKPDPMPDIDHIIVKATDTRPRDWKDEDINRYKAENDHYHKAFASRDCFPDADISDVIRALEDGFGIRFLFDDNYQRVRIVLLRNLFQSDTVQEVACNILSESKTENGIRGFCMTYGDSEDTHFYYKGFADKLPHKQSIWVDDSDTHDYSNWDLNAEYASVINKVSAFNKTCYVTPNTGNAYGIKVDKDAKNYEDLHPSLFGFADFMDAEDGDCTGEEETIETISLGFTPAIVNDLNMEEERNSGLREQRFALFVDEQMRPRRPDLEDLEQPKSYNDPDVLYDVKKLYSKYGKNGKNGKMVHGEIVAPGEFSIMSDASAAASLVETTLKFSFYDWDEKYKTVSWPIVMTIEGRITEGYRLYLQDNFEPNDDGVSPIESHDWGLTLGIMRGSGSDAYVDYTPDDDDGEGNDTWGIVSGSSATAHPDTCDNYGNLWDYNGSDGQTLHCNTPAEAISAMRSMWPNSNIDLVNRNENSLITKTSIQHTRNDQGKDVALLFAMSTKYSVLYTGRISDYAKKFKGKTLAQMYAFDSGSSGFGILIEANSSMERSRTLMALQEQAFAGGAAVIIDGGDNGMGVTEGRFSLKLRAEKPNPYFDPTRQEGSEVISTRNEAAAAMTRLFTTANTDLLSRQKVDNDIMRRAGWDAPGDGYATVMSVEYGVEYSNGTVHEILWTPIQPGGAVLRPSQLQTYIDSFNGLAPSDIIVNDTRHLILDIDTTEERAVLLHKLQAIYYAEEGEAVDSVTLPDSNRRYLGITNPNLRGRGLIDQFYKEYSYWTRNARIANFKLDMGIAELMALDDTTRMKIGDVTGLMKDLEFEIDMQSGLQPATLKLMYI